jgi:hypothetical protein
MGDLRAILVEGLFYIQDGKITTDRGDLLYEHLEPLVGHDIQLAVHFLPPSPPDPTKWGGGCCMWQPAECPAGHHEHPDRILNIALRGVLGRDPGSRWFLDTFDGKQVDLPFALLDGHHGRVAAATVFDVQAMQESLAEKITPESLEALGVRANNLRDLMERLRIHTEGGK